MGKLFFAGLCAVVCCVVAGCSSPETKAPVAAEAVTSLPSSPTLPPTTSVPPGTTAVPSSSEPTAAFPAGFPKVVTVRSLPSQVRNWYQMKGTTKAVQLAPGVWTPLQDGAEVQDAVSAEVIDGFCSSVKAFERQYREGRTYGGVCW